MWIMGHGLMVYITCNFQSYVLYQHNERKKWYLESCWYWMYELTVMWQTSFVFGKYTIISLYFKVRKPPNYQVGPLVLRGKSIKSQRISVSIYFWMNPSSSCCYYYYYYYYYYSVWGKWQTAQATTAQSSGQNVGSSYLCRQLILALMYCRCHS